MKWRWFVIGMIIGFLLGTLSTVGASVLFKENNGYLHGWSVMIKGRALCYDPYVWVRMKEIEC